MFAPMKLISQIVIIVFITFILTPSIVSVINKSDTVSICWDLAEEELIKKEGKNFLFNSFNHEVFISLKMTSKIILSENLSKHEMISASIFIPPPDRA